MTKPELFSRTLMVQGPPDTLARFARAFGVAERFVVTQQDDTFDYFDTHAPALVYSRIEGDFSYYIEPHLWDFSEQKFADILQDLGGEDLAIALPDETSESPFRYVLFLDHERHQIDIDEDEVFDENFVIGQPALRKRLRQMSGTAK